MAGRLTTGPATQPSAVYSFTARPKTVLALATSASHFANCSGVKNCTTRSRAVLRSAMSFASTSALVRFGFFSRAVSSAVFSWAFWASVSFRSAAILVLQEQDPPRAPVVVTAIALRPVGLLARFDDLRAVTVRTLHGNVDHPCPPRTLIMRDNKLKTGSIHFSPATPHSKTKTVTFGGSSERAKGERPPLFPLEPRPARLLIGSGGGHSRPSHGVVYPEPMWTGVNRLALGVTLVGALAAALYYLGHSQAVPPLGPQVSALLSLDLLRLVVYLALFLALALVLLRQQAVERRLPRYEALTEVQEERLRARDEEIARLQERLAEKEEERKRAAAMLMAFLKSADAESKEEPTDR